MDRDLESLSGAAAFSWRRLWVTLLVCAAIMVMASFLVRTFPNSGYQAGYDAASAKDPMWVRTGIDAAAGTALPLCDELHAESEASPSQPRYEYDSFIKGCGKALDHLYGQHVPMLPGR